jgi:hypothetical protein
MGKHESGYKRVEKDAYPTPAWVTAALLKHVAVAGKAVWEPAAGSGQMAEVLKAAGAQVYCTDIQVDGYPLDRQFDFLAEGNPGLPADFIITNPPYGCGKLIGPFIEAGLRRLGPRGALALLLPVDCDSAKGRLPYFRDCAEFDCKIILTKRIAWFKRSDGKLEAPKENHAWYLWRRPRHGSPVILYDEQLSKVAPIETAPTANGARSVRAAGSLCDLTKSKSTSNTRDVPRIRARRHRAAEA